MAGVELGRRLLGAGHGDVLRQRGVQRLGHPIRGRTGLDVDRHHVCKRVDAGIGTAGDREVAWVATDVVERLVRASSTVRSPGCLAQPRNAVPS